MVQATLRVVKVFWSLEDKLAYQRHFPAISWLNSYSLYHENLEHYYRDNLPEDFMEMRQEAMRLLQQEAELAEIVRLVGVDALSAKDRLILETAKSIREDFLHQNAFDEIDTYTSTTKEYQLLKIIFELHYLCEKMLDGGVLFRDVQSLAVREEISRAKFIPEERLVEFDAIRAHMTSEVETLSREEGIV